MAQSIIQSTYIDTVDHVFSNVAQIKAFFETFTANKTGEFHEILTVVHTDSSETGLQPHVRWTGILTKDSGGHTITLQRQTMSGKSLLWHTIRSEVGEYLQLMVHKYKVRLQIDPPDEEQTELEILIQNGSVTV